MSEKVPRKKIALFIDSENISYKFLEHIFKYLDEMGEVCIKKAYGDWRKESMRGWDEVLKRYCIEPIHIITGNLTKNNSSDIRIAIDVMHTLYEGKMECIALATSDSDFAHLAQEIRTKGVESIGFGEQKSREDLKNSFSSFYELVSQKTKNKITHEQKRDPKTMDIEILKKAVVDNFVLDGYWANLSQVGAYLKEHHGLTPRDYKRANWSKVFKQYDDDFIFKLQGSIFYVSLKEHQQPLQSDELHSNFLTHRYRKICSFFGFTH